MPQGQPNLPGVLDFDTTTVAVTASPGLDPINIVQVGEPFAVALNFQGSGFVWNWLKPPFTPGGAPYQIQYFAESVGPGSNNVLLGVRAGNLTAANAYGPAATQLNIAVNPLAQGIYQISCLVRFPNNPGLTGYAVMADYLEVYA